MQLAPAAWSDLPAFWRRALLLRLGCFAALASDDGLSAARARPQHAKHVAADVDAFEAFFDLHERDIFGYLWRLTGEEQAARDLTQETFLRAWQHFEQVSAYDRPRAWLFRVATHLALNHLRFRRVADRILGSATPGESAVSRDHAGQVAEQDAVRCALLALSPRERSALVLHEVVGLSCAELAETLHISLSAAKVTLWRAREHFRACYTREEGADAE